MQSKDFLGIDSRMFRSFIFFVSVLYATNVDAQYHVSVKGNDDSKGIASHPFRTISKAASVAQPGETIIVHAGVYREMVQPPRGGSSDKKRIVYTAAPGEKVVIKGSEIVKGWVKMKEDLWKVKLPYSFFGKYNPFTDKVWGDWYGGWLHTGEVYLNEKPLSEDSLQNVFHNIPVMVRHGEPKEMMPARYTWSCRSDSGKTTIYARFGDYDPNKETVEVNVRPACFYPKENNINYITVKGFHMSMAATQWAAPTAEQPGLIGTNWSKGWIIEDNVISNSRCTGITLGKDRGTGDNMWSKDGSIDGSVHYNDLVHRVIVNGWNKATIGSHIVRNNTIFNCGQAGICGSFGGAFSEIYDNNIFNVYTYRPFGGAEMAGIKLHAAIDVQIHDNYIHNANLGLWLDWMAQGTRVSRNLFHDNDNTDLFLEVDHGPFVIDNNIFLSTNAIQDWSEGGAFLHNIIGGTVATFKQRRRTPYFKPHTTEWIGIQNIKGGDDRYYNNVFTGKKETAKPAYAFFQPENVKQHEGLDVYDSVEYNVMADGNLYTNGATPGAFETNSHSMLSPEPQLRFNDDGTVLLNWSSPAQKGTLITSDVLGKVKIPNQRFENPDGSALSIDLDYFGKKRNTTTPNAGPFETFNNLTIWPKK
jgi:hypothetical protein